MAFDRVEPFGDEWRQTARICGTIAQCLTGEKIDEEKLMPLPQQDQTPEEARRNWERIMFRQNAAASE